MSTTGTKAGKGQREGAPRPGRVLLPGTAGPGPRQAAEAWGGLALCTAPRCHCCGTKG